MRILGTLIISVLLSLFGVNVWNFSTNSISIKNTVILILCVSLWNIAYNNFTK